VPPSTPGWRPEGRGVTALFAATPTSGTRTPCLHVWAALPSRRGGGPGRVHRARHQAVGRRARRDPGLGTPSFDVCPPGAVLPRSQPVAVTVALTTSIGRRGGSGCHPRHRGGTQKEGASRRFLRRYPLLGLEAPGPVCLQGIHLLGRFSPSGSLVIRTLCARRAQGGLEHVAEHPPDSVPSGSTATWTLEANSRFTR
jgi:hypothetical protein